MLSSAFDHPKIRAFGRLLKIPRLHAAGICGQLWTMTAKSAPQGNIGKYSDEDLALACDWDGDPAEFVSALVKCRLLDQHPDPKIRLLVHDWQDHAPRWLRGNLSRMGKKVLSTDSVATEYRLSTDSERTQQGVPTPLPLPLPLPKNPPNPPSGGEGSQEKPKRTKPPAEPIEFPPSLDTAKFRSAWSDWLAYKGKAYKPASQRTLLKQLAEKGHDDAIARIERSIANGWAGLIFADERGNGGAAGNHRKAATHFDAAAERRAARASREFPETYEPIPDPFASGPFPIGTAAGVVGPIKHPAAAQGKHA